MAGKILELSEAAQQLGVTAEQLIEMRSRGEIFGYRDGTSWKFKQEEVERVAQERSGGDDPDNEILSADDNEFATFVTGLSSKITAERPEEDPESILLTDDELTLSDHGGSGAGASGSIKMGSVIKDGSHKDGDIQLASDSQLESASGQKASDILGASPPKGPSATDLMLAKSDSGKLADDGELTLDSLGDLSLGSAIDDGLELSAKDEESSDDLMLADDSDSVGDELKLSSDAPSAPSLDDKAPSDFDLGLDDVFGDDMPKPGRGSGHGSDVTHGGGDSGINLAPSDGGLSLEDEPLDLGGSAVESLELPEDDDVIELENAADPDQATQLKADDQFMLSPSDALGEDESDSGSQVIALEDSESFDQDAATMLNAQQGFGGDALVAEDAFGQPAMMGGPGMAPGASGAYAGQFAPQPVEIPYSIWQVLSLFLLTGILTIAGMLMVDVVSNMWAYEGNGTAATFVMDAVISMVGLDK